MQVAKYDPDVSATSHIISIFSILWINNNTSNDQSTKYQLVKIAKQLVELKYDHMNRRFNLT